MEWQMSGGDTREAPKVLKDRATENGFDEHNDLIEGLSEEEEGNVDEEALKSKASDEATLETVVEKAVKPEKP